MVRRRNIVRFSVPVSGGLTAEAANVTSVRASARSAGGEGLPAPQRRCVPFWSLGFRGAWPVCAGSRAKRFVEWKCVACSATESTFLLEYTEWISATVRVSGALLIRAVHREGMSSHHTPYRWLRSGRGWLPAQAAHIARARKHTVRPQTRRQALPTPSHAISPIAAQPSSLQISQARVVWFLANAPGARAATTPPCAVH